MEEILSSCKFEENGFHNIVCDKNDEEAFVTVRSNAIDYSSFEQWKEIFCELSQVSLNSYRLLSSGEDSRNVFGQVLVCQYGVKGRCNGKRTTRTNCPFKLRVVIKKVTKDKVKKDRLMTSHPCFIKIRGEHNHSTTCADALKRLRILPSVRSSLEEYFEQGMGAAEAFRAHSLRMEAEGNVDGVTRRDTNPSKRAFAYHLDIWLKNRPGDRARHDGRKRSSRRRKHILQEIGIDSLLGSPRSPLKSQETVVKVSTSAASDPSEPSTSGLTSSTDLKRVTHSGGPAEREDFGLDSPLHEYEAPDNPDSSAGEETGLSANVRSAQADDEEMKLSSASVILSSGGDVQGPSSSCEQSAVESSETADRGSASAADAVTVSAGSASRLVSTSAGDGVPFTSNTSRALAGSVLKSNDHKPFILAGTQATAAHARPLNRKLGPARTARAKTVGTRAQIIKGRTGMSPGVIPTVNLSQGLSPAGSSKISGHITVWVPAVRASMGQSSCSRLPNSGMPRPSGWIPTPGAAIGVPTGGMLAVGGAMARVPASGVFTGPRAATGVPVTGMIPGPRAATGVSVSGMVPGPRAATGVPVTGMVPAQNIANALPAGGVLLPASAATAPPEAGVLRAPSASRLASCGWAPAVSVDTEMSSSGAEPPPGGDVEATREARSTNGSLSESEFADSVVCQPDIHVLSECSRLNRESVSELFSEMETAIATFGDENTEAAIRQMKDRIFKLSSSSALNNALSSFGAGVV